LQKPIRIHMSTTRGIFESFSNQSAARTDSPFAVVNEPAAPAALASPFTAAARQDSPFAVVDDGGESRSEPARPARTPEPRKSDSPFQAAEPPEGFGFEAPAKPHAAAPIEAAPASPPALSSPFATSPFSAGASSPTHAAIAAFGSKLETTAPPPPAATVPQAFSQPAASAATVPTAFAPAPQSPAPIDESNSDSFSIRQLELRAIFGVERELNTEEILQRSRALPGIRNLARLSAQDLAAVEALKQLLPSLGFGSGTLKLYSGSVPLEFIREGSVMLGVQTDGGFAPGVRETLMLVARELGRLS
jgi:hypothetical protein